MKTGAQGLALIKHFEGLHDGNLKVIGCQPKMCPAGIWTVGYGYALVNKKTGHWLKGAKDFPLIHEQYPEYENMTIEQAERLLATVLAKYEGIVDASLKILVPQNQFDALISHTYNTGGSTMLFSLVNQRADMPSIVAWFEGHYTTGDGKVLPGLVKRRKSEALLFSKNQLILT